MTKRPIPFIAAGLVLAFIAGAIYIAAGFAGSKPDVIIITAGSLRPDHLGAYGYKRIQTAAIDALAKNGIIFTNAYASVPSPGLSYAAILTGKDPSGAIRMDENVTYAADSLVTLAERLKPHGYKTLAVISDTANRSLMALYKKGFDVFENVAEGLSDEKALSRGTMVTQKALAALQASKGKGPVFAWIEYSIPRYPYQVPQDFESAKDDFPYERQVMLLDKELSALTEGLKRRGLYKNSIIVFTGTNGEGLYEHFEPDHGVFVYDATVRVPLVIKFPAQPRIKKAGTPAVLADIAPTILGALKVGYAKSDFDGRDLMVEARKKGARTIYLEALKGYFNFGWSPVAAVVADNFKYIEAPTPELYDLASDPHELKNIAAVKAEKAAALKDMLLGYLREKRPELAKALNKGEDPKSKARVLGPYLLSVTQLQGADVNFLINLYEKLLIEDPKNKVFKFNIARLYLRGDKPYLTEYYLSKLTEEYPGFAPAWEVLADYYGQQKDTENAVRCYEKALTLAPDSPPALNNLAWLYANKGVNLDKALIYAEKANELAPNVPSFIDTLAEAYMKIGNSEKAKELANKAAALDPTSDYLKKRVEEFSTKR